MNYSFEYIDIILLAMIAGFIFLRLRGILGKRTGFDGKVPPKFEEVLNKVKTDNIKKSYKHIYCSSHMKDFQSTFGIKKKTKLELKELFLEHFKEIVA